jgi:hypothetical protein
MLYTAILGITVRASFGSVKRSNFKQLQALPRAHLPSIVSETKSEIPLQCGLPFKPCFADNCRSPKPGGTETK